MVDDRCLLLRVEKSAGSCFRKTSVLALKTIVRCPKRRRGLLRSRLGKGIKREKGGSVCGFSIENLELIIENMRSNVGLIEN